MLTTGAIKLEPEAWKDLYFPNADNLFGS